MLIFFCWWLGIKLGANHKFSVHTILTFTVLFLSVKIIRHKENF